MTIELRAEPRPLAEPDARFREAQHRIANNLALVAGFVRLQANAIARVGEPLSASAVAGLLEEVGSRVETIGRLHRLLSRDSGDRVDMVDYLRQTCSALNDTMGQGVGISVRFVAETTWETSAEQAGPIALVVNELVTNAIKYAHPTGVAGRVHVSCRRSPHGMQVCVADDGVGLPDGFNPLTDGGLGLRVVRSLAQQAHARLSFESEGIGLAVRLLLPGQPAPSAGK
jgi:two-component sensor histidine kinase